jgi:hypothetical protein
MKLVFLMYLEDDDTLVRTQLEQMSVQLFSQLPLEGHGAGASGWYGEVVPYRSRLAFAVVPDDQANALLGAVRSWPAGQDPQHPVRAFQVNIEEAVTQLTDTVLGGRS